MIILLIPAVFYKIREYLLEFKGTLVLVKVNLILRLSSLREMTIPRNDTVGIKPSTKKTVGIDRFHKLFMTSNHRKKPLEKILVASLWLSHHSSLTMVGSSQP